MVPAADSDEGRTGSCSEIEIRLEAHLSPVSPLPDPSEIAVVVVRTSGLPMLIQDHLLAPPERVEAFSGCRPRRWGRSAASTGPQPRRPRRAPDYSRHEELPSHRRRRERPS